jgi:hypothetical protein
MTSPPHSTSDNAREALVRKVQNFRDSFRRGSAGWAVAYHLSLFGAAVLSAAAALFIKLSNMENLAAVLATSAAVLTTLSSVGDFQRKWHADRDAFYALDELLLRASEPEALPDGRLKQLLIRIIRTQHGSWTRGVGDASETTDVDPSGGGHRRRSDTASGEV